MLMLHRAIAYRLHRLDDVDHDWPETVVFWESDRLAAAPAKLLRLLALTWSCEPADIEFFNSHTELELLAAGGYGGPELGDAALLVTGWHHGPLFASPDRTLSLVSPMAFRRLRAARRASLPHQRRQRAAADAAAGVTAADSAYRQRLLMERLEATQTDMGALC